MKRKKLTVIGLLGPTKDAGYGPKRWERWRPTVSICQHDDLLVDRLVLLSEKNHEPLAKVIQKDVRAVSPETKVEPVGIRFDDPWDLEEVYAALHDFAKSYPFKPETEDYLVHITTGTHVAQICLFLLTEAHYFPAKLLQTSPPKKYRSKLAGKYRVIDLDLSIYDRLASRFEREQKEGLSFLKAGIETRNKAFNQLMRRIEKVAIAARDPLLLMGPTGAGKSSLARRIYDLKHARRQVGGKFVEINCATIRGDAAMSALFGHKKGAFTGAIADREGLLRLADGGLLFLDEVGELGPDEQSMLLRALEEKVFLPVGSDKEVRSEFQLITGTNRNLADLVRTGRFREDLLARINLWTFSLPGLAERREDIEPNIEYELDGFARATGRHVTFNREAREAFLKFGKSSKAAWTGNFRDLNGAITRMATLAPGGRITMEGVKEEIGRLQKAWSKPLEGDGLEIVEEALGLGRTSKLDRFDIVQLAEVLKVCHRSPSMAAAGRELFAASRSRRKSTNDADRVRKYLVRFDLSWADVRDLR